MNFYLPESVEIGDREFSIRWEYRDVLTILAALADPELDEHEKTVAALAIFYPDADSIRPEEYEEALKQLDWFIAAGDERKDRKGPKLMDWEQDFPYIIAPINRVLGKDVRGKDQVHWWTFLSAYYEIGDCLFAQVVRIRDKRSRGKPLDKTEREWANKNADLIRFRTHYTDAEDELLAAWAGKGVSEDAGED